MNSLVRAGVQVAGILFFAILLGLAFNANRPTPLPLSLSQAGPAQTSGQTSDQPPAISAPSADQAAEVQPAEQVQSSEQIQDQSSEQAPGQASVQISDQGPADPAASRDILFQDAAALFQSGEAVFLDARDAESYAAGHIQGALHLSPEEAQPRFAQIAPLLEGRTVIAYCDGEMCRLSHDLAEQCAALGLPGVRVLQNGWTLWQDAALPITTGDQP